MLCFLGVHRWRQIIFCCRCLCGRLYDYNRMHQILNPRQFCNYSWNQLSFWQFWIRYLLEQQDSSVHGWTRIVHPTEWRSIILYWQDWSPFTSHLRLMFLWWFVVVFECCCETIACHVFKCLTVFHMEYTRSIYYSSIASSCCSSSATILNTLSIWGETNQYKLHKSIRPLLLLTWFQYL